MILFDRPYHLSLVLYMFDVHTFFLTNPLGRLHTDIIAYSAVGRMLHMLCLKRATGGQIGDNDSADDIKTVDLNKVHYLSGPIRVVDEQGVSAKPGDVSRPGRSNIGNRNNNDKMPDCLLSCLLFQWCRYCKFARCCVCHSMRRVRSVVLGCASH